MSEVRAPVCLTDINCALYAPATSSSVPRSTRLSRPSSAARSLSSSARCASVKNSWFAYLGERCKGVSDSSVQMPCRSGSPHGVFSTVVGADAFTEATGA